MTDSVASLTHLQEWRPKQYELATPGELVLASSYRKKEA
jgi:hypothetical protein